MERESFEDEEVAEKLNKNFIAIKVDREERPDIDSIYMEVCQAMTGSGGWPLTIVMTPDKKPFFSGTYFPKYDHVSMPGLMTILDSIIEKWNADKEKLMEFSDNIVNHIKRNYSGIHSSKTKADKEIFKEAFEQFRKYNDRNYGGFGSAPKFPTPQNLYFLLRYYHENMEPYALEMVEKTLQSMYKGGIFDHLGYGFSRYSTDWKWHVPHFEKMLYDNALLAIAYLEAYQATKNKLYAEVAEKIFTYVLRDMKSPEGGFYSAEDADSEGEEGKFYIWTKDEISRVLGEVRAEEFFKAYALTSFGNIFLTDITGTSNSLESIKTDLLRSREMRVRPHLDDKILTSWNGLMIAALAIGGRVLKNITFLKAAEHAINFIYKYLVRDDGRLMARYRDGESAILAYADDYVFLTWGLIELYESTFKTEYLSKALVLTDDLINRFEDKEKGGLFLYGDDSEELFVRPKEIYDGAIPSANSVAVQNFIRLSKLTGKFELEDAANRIIRHFSGTVNMHPRGYAFFLSSLMLSIYRTHEIVLVTDDAYKNSYERLYKDGDRSWGAAEMIQELNEKYNPFSVTLLVAPGTDIEELVPMVSDYKTVDGKTTAYICSNHACREPITDVKKLFMYL